MNGGVGHAETTETTTEWVCRRCEGARQLIGGDPLLPASMRKAVHEDGGEMCAGTGELAAPITPGLVSWP